jgi:hypothetical protein
MIQAPGVSVMKEKKVYGIDTGKVLWPQMLLMKITWAQCYKTFYGRKLLMVIES